VGSSCSVLLVDDEPLVLESLARMLRRYGFRVEVVGNGREGLERAMTLRPDWVISDVRMPVMDGPTMVRAMRERGFTGPRIAFLSGYNDLTTEQYRALGVECMLAKPASTGQLLALLRSEGSNAPGG